MDQGIVINYAKYRWIQHYHYQRYKRRVESMERKLFCQECGGAGGWTDRILEDGTGPWEPCGWCCGTGLLTPWLRGLWLRERRKGR